MHRIWTRGISLGIIGFLALVIVADADAGHRRRRRGCGCGGGADYGYAPGYYGNSGYGAYGYGGGYAGYAPANGHYGGVANASVPTPVAGATVDQLRVTGTANADVGSIDRSARVGTSAQAGVSSNSDLRVNAPQDAPPAGSVNSSTSAGVDANLPATPPVAP